jgi:hypothetical protein
MNDTSTPVVICVDSKVLKALCVTVVSIAGVFVIATVIKYLTDK